MHLAAFLVHAGAFLPALLPILRFRGSLPRAHPAAKLVPPAPDPPARDDAPAADVADELLATKRDYRQQTASDLAVFKARQAEILPADDRDNAVETTMQYRARIASDRKVFKAEQLSLIREVQRYLALEEINERLERTESELGPQSVRVIDTAWAEAAGLSMEELQQAVQEGIRAREEIVAQNLGLVYKELRKFVNRIGLDRGLTEDDLVQEGSLALLRAAEKFDCTKGLQFSTYATVAVRYALQRATMEKARLVHVPSHVFGKYRKINKVRNQVFLELGRNPTVEELVAALQDAGATGRWVSPKGVRKVLDAVEKRPSSLDAPAKYGSSDIRTLLDRLDAKTQSPEQAMQSQFLGSRVMDIIDDLLEPEVAQVIVMRFGLGGGKPQTIMKMAEALGLPYEKTRLRVLAGLRKLRRGLEDLGEDL